MSQLHKKTADPKPGEPPKAQGPDLVPCELCTPLDPFCVTRSHDCPECKGLLFVPRRR